MLVHRWDAPTDDTEWATFLTTQGFGHLVASGRDRDVPVVVPTQFVVDDDEVLIHLARPNPIWAAIDENPTVVLSVAGDWAYIPAAWKAIADEDPRQAVADRLAQRAGPGDPAARAHLLRRLSDQSTP